MISLVRNGLSFLQRSTVQSFGDTVNYLWVRKSTDAAGVYSQKLQSLASLPRMTAGSAGGMLSMQTGQRNWHCTAADFQRAPEVGDVILWGPASEHSLTVSAASCEKWRIVQLQPFGEQITLVAEPND